MVVEEEEEEVEEEEEEEEVVEEVVEEEEEEEEEEKSVCVCVCVCVSPPSNSLLCFSLPRSNSPSTPFHPSFFSCNCRLKRFFSAAT